jgi:hypothetical protein
MDRFRQLEDSILPGPQPTEQDLQQAKKNNSAAKRTFEEARAMGFDLRNSRGFSKFVTETAIIRQYIEQQQTPHGLPKGRLCRPRYPSPA